MKPQPFVERPVSVAHLDAANAVLVAQEYLRLRSWSTAVALCSSWLERHGPSTPMRLVLASARFGLGDREGALSLIAELLDEEPQHLLAQFYRAQMLGVARGVQGRAEALRLLRGIVDREPDFPGAQGALSAVTFPGPYYRRVLEAMHHLLRPRTYLEIGVETGATLALARGAEVAVGVDPVDAVDVALPAGARRYTMESDEFFARHTRASVFGDLPLDLVFIDGMHLFEYALRDFSNVEKWSHAGTVVVLHDCLPSNPHVATRERRTKFWAGDTWKVFEVLRAARPDLRCAVVPAPPSGLLVVRGLDATSSALDDQMATWLKRFRDAPYPYEPGAWPEELAIVSNDEPGLRISLGL